MSQGRKSLGDFAAEYGTTDSIQPDVDHPRHLTKVVPEMGVNTWKLSDDADPLNNARDPVEKDREFFCRECSCRVTVSPEADNKNFALGDHDVDEYGHARDCKHSMDRDKTNSSEVAVDGGEQ